MAVKPKYIKDLAKEIHHKYPEAITTSFSDNKLIVNEATNVESQEVRNRIAGHLCNLKSREETSENQ